MTALSFGWQPSKAAGRLRFQSVAGYATPLVVLALAAGQTNASHPAGFTREWDDLTRAHRVFRSNGRVPMTLLITHSACLEHISPRRAIPNVLTGYAPSSECLSTRSSCSSYASNARGQN
jgi:hypothetical protein